MGERIAIVGSGISGLGAAWALERSNDVVVFEADSRVGGHSNTVDVATPSGVTSVDTGFIVYNETTYPNLTRLFSELGVPTEESDMSFAFSLDARFEYGASASGILGRPSNLLKPRFLAMLRDVNRFRRIGSHLHVSPGETLSEFLSRNNFSSGFIQDYMYPMTGAIWSTGGEEMGDFPAESIMRFLANHGLISIAGRPRWRTVTGGSRSYVRRLTARFDDKIRVNTPVTSLFRLGDQVLVEADGRIEPFDQVVLATHSDQALSILGDEATPRERALLGSIPYQENDAILHSDPSLMPSSTRVWSSWNAMASTDGALPGVASVTYWMNRLQNLDDSVPLFVSLNPLHEPNPGLVHGRFRYAHPRFSTAATAAQEQIAEIQGSNRTWFAGAYLGYGFHEDGLQSGLNVAAGLGSPAPWHGQFTPISSAKQSPRMSSAK